MKTLSKHGDPHRVAQARSLIGQLLGPVRLESEADGGLLAHVEIEGQRLALMASRRVQSMVAGVGFEPTTFGL